MGKQDIEKEYCTAIILAAGRGSRMGSKIKKQYLLLAGHPVLYYSLKTFQDSEVIDEIILVAGPGEEEYCQENFVKKYGLSKVSRIVEGGRERYHSVWNALQQSPDEGYIFIHDGARPFVDEDILGRAYREVRVCKACVAGMPVKDTIKIADVHGNVTDTPDRALLWNVQTPQVFEAGLIKNAYNMLLREPCIQVTDDAMVIERMTGHPVKLIRGSYQNIKITTPEDLEVGEIFARRLKTDIGRSSKSPKESPKDSKIVVDAENDLC